MTKKTKKSPKAKTAIAAGASASTQEALTYGQTLRSMRKQIGLTQAGLGLLLGVDLNTICRWENDQRLPDAQGAIVLAMKYLALERATSLEDIFKNIRNRLDELNSLRQQLEADRALHLAIAVAAAAGASGLG